METDEILVQSVDKSTMPPLHQKRILAFVNHFLIQSCTFLNEFAIKCENKFIELERQMQKAEAALTIIEAKLASIPDVGLEASSTDTIMNENTTKRENIASPNDTQMTADNIQLAADNKSQVEVDEEPIEGVRAFEDLRYKKFFKMVQFGVPAEAVKLKMRAEGLDTSILDTPNLMLSDTNGSNS